MAYLDELADWVRKRDQRESTSKKKRRRMDQHQVAFLAVRSDVVAGLGAGYTLWTIHEHMRELGRLTCTYETFRKLANRYCSEALPPRRGRRLSTTSDAPRARAAENVARETVQPAVPVAGSPNTRDPSAATGHTQSRSRGAPGIGSFTFNPDPKSDEEMF